MAKRGPPFRTDVKVSVDDIRQALADVALEKRSRNHISPGAMKTFVHDESVRTGICRTKIFDKIRQITLQRASGVIQLDFSLPKKRGKKTPNCTDSLTKR
jgi:hypothetical protein